MGKKKERIFEYLLMLMLSRLLFSHHQWASITIIISICQCGNWGGWAYYYAEGMEVWKYIGTQWSEIFCVSFPLKTTTGIYYLPSYYKSTFLIYNKSYCQPKYIRKDLINDRSLWMRLWWGDHINTWELLTAKYWCKHYNIIRAIHKEQT